jgi:threonine dehydrogenase-like Zn-dependent dehydrogenase
VTFPCWVDQDRDRELADDLAARRVVIEPLITHRIPSADAAAACELVVEHPEASLGMVLTWA